MSTLDDILATLKDAQDQRDELSRGIHEMVKPFVEEAYPEYADPSNGWLNWSFRSVDVENRMIHVNLVRVNDRGPNDVEWRGINVDESRLFDEDYQEYLRLKAIYEP